MLSTWNIYYSFFSGKARRGEIWTLSQGISQNFDKCLKFVSKAGAVVGISRNFDAVVGWLGAVTSDNSPAQE